jgi:hypothetical protein
MKLLIKIVSIFVLPVLHEGRLQAVEGYPS